MWQSENWWALQHCPARLPIPPSQQLPYTHRQPGLRPHKQRVRKAAGRRCCCLHSPQPAERLQDGTSMHEGRREKSASRDAARASRSRTPLTSADSTNPPQPTAQSASTGSYKALFWHHPAQASHAHCQTRAPPTTQPNPPLNLPPPGRTKALSLLTPRTPNIYLTQPQNPPQNPRPPGRTQCPWPERSPAASAASANAARSTPQAQAPPRCRSRCCCRSRCW